MDAFLGHGAQKDDIVNAGYESFKIIFHELLTKDLGDLRFDIFSKLAT